jgi:hypothetical protein
MRIPDELIVPSVEGRRPGTPPTGFDPSQPWSPEGMLHLQRSVGNRAVVIQRQDAPPMPGPETETGPDGLPPGYHVVHGITVCFGQDRGAHSIEQHNWIEIYDESYGWYPRDQPERVSDPDGFRSRVLFLNVPGVLNAQTWLPEHGTPTRDKHHGQPARRFSVAAPAGQQYATIAPKLRAFATGFKEPYSWNPFGTDCHEFVTKMLAVCNLVMAAEIPPGSPVI